ncbi:MAG: hypothetical protein IPI33_15570 [Dehalococcoidia bacterium]|nr:hypothetical protein [Dehalococcoidia bacterium]
MKSLQNLALLALIPASILGAATPADDFYLVRLQAGKAEAAAGRHYDAIDDFRIASFGFIDQPALLIEGLARLALVQEAAGRKEDAEATLRRLVEIERRFDGWAQADLEPETRAVFSALLTTRVGAEAARRPLRRQPWPSRRPWWPRGVTWRTSASSWRPSRPTRGTGSSERRSSRGPP